MGVTQEEGWRTATDPRHLLRLSRVRPGGRKYALLACAAVRRLVPGPRTELGDRSLTALETFVLAQPARGVAAHLWREVVLRHVPGIPDPLPFNWNVGADGGWAEQFAYRLGPLSQVHTAEVNVVFELALARVRIGAGQEAYREAEALAARLALEGPAAPAGWFARLLRQVVPPTPQARLDGARFRAAVLDRLPEGTRARAEAEWPSGSGGFSPWQRGLALLTADRERQRLSELNARACALVREVFGDPFAPAVIDPAWLECNHGAARHIADRVAATGDFSGLPILADALEDVGCADRELLGHLRDGDHLPGCWALDAVLGRG
jgi:hypothetical protein